MIPNCGGCEEDLNWAIYLQDRCGYYFAGGGLGVRGHLVMRMVDDEGKVMVE